MNINELQGWLKCPACSYMKKEETSMITLKEILMGRAKFEDLPEDLQKNGTDLLEKLNKFRALYGKPMYVSSGYRPPDVNKAAGGGSKSAHLTLQACDFRDADGELKKFVAENPDVLEKCDLYMENPAITKTWLHLQTRKTKAGNRIFNP
jgi:hypothetical protein